MKNGPRENFPLYSSSFKLVKIRTRHNIISQPLLRLLQAWLKLEPGLHFNITRVPVINPPSAKPVIIALRTKRKK